MSELLTTQAMRLLREGDIKTSLDIYKKLKKDTGLSCWDFNIAKLSGDLSRETTTQRIEEEKNIANSLYSALEKNLQIDHIYVVNLKRRLDRKLKALRELEKHAISATFVDAVDAGYSKKALLIHNEYKSRPISEKYVSSSHIPHKSQNYHKQNLSPGVFGYLLSQRNVLRDAKKKGFKKILVFDDDIFFSSDAMQKVKNIADTLRDKWKILLLGASEYSDKKSEEFMASRLKSNEMLYHPIPGLTCGSFAVAYDESIFDELLLLIEEFDSTFDNGVLGALYKKYHKDCYVIDPAACIPDVTESDIREECRKQIDQSKRMNWETQRFVEYSSPIRLTILINSFDCVHHIQKICNNKISEINLCVFYLSDDGLRPIIPGRQFNPKEKSPLRIIPNDSEDFKRIVRINNVPFSEIIMLWPPDLEVTENAIRIECIKIIQEIQEQKLNKVTEDKKLKHYLLNMGKRPEKGFHSIIIPSFRKAEDVWPTIKSALCQNIEEFEVLVINDNPDNTNFESKIKKMFEDDKTEGLENRINNLKIINHKLNRNASAARNTGIYASRGEYISFLDDDDIYEPNRLLAISKKLSESEPIIGACYCGYTGAWNGAKDSSRFREGNFIEELLKLEYTKHYICTNTVTYKKAAILKIAGFNESYSRHQDLEMNTRFFMNYKITSVQAYCVANRPSPVPETFNANVESLCLLKAKYLSDFKNEIKEKSEKFIKEVIEAHASDILKRLKNIDDNTKDIVFFFLKSAMS